MTTTFVRHNRISLAVHELRGGSGPRLLHLHGLGERSPSDVPAWLAAWPGPVSALDLTGHGASTRPHGGGYSAEVLTGDVDAALAALGPCTLYGRGLGAYVALLAAGGRPELVRGAILDDGPGMAGGSPEPTSPTVVAPPVLDTAPDAPDPWALVELTRDTRPGEYAVTVLRLAVMGSAIADPVAVVARMRPAWLRAVVDDPSAVTEDLTPALIRFANGA